MTPYPPVPLSFFLCSHFSANLPGRGHETLSRDDPETGVSTWALHTRPWKACPGGLLDFRCSLACPKQGCHSSRDMPACGIPQLLGSRSMLQKDSTQVQWCTHCCGLAHVTSVISQHLLLIQPVDPRNSDYPCFTSSVLQTSQTSQRSSCPAADSSTAGTQQGQAWPKGSQYTPFLSSFLPFRSHKRTTTCLPSCATKLQPPCAALAAADVTWSTRLSCSLQQARLQHG